MGVYKCGRFQRLKNLWDERAYALQTAGIETRQWIACAIENDRELTEHQMAMRARVPAFFAMARSNRGYKREMFVNRDFNAVLNIRLCAVLKTIPQELTRCDLVGQPLRLIGYNEKLKLIAGGQSKKAARTLRVNTYIFTLHGHQTCIVVLIYNVWVVMQVQFLSRASDLHSSHRCSIPRSTRAPLHAACRRPGSSPANAQYKRPSCLRFAPEAVEVHQKLLKCTRSCSAGW